MFKLVVLFSVVAIAAAKPGFVAPVAYSAVPVSSVSQYRSDVVHGAPLVAPAVYGPAVYPAVAPLAQAPHSPAVVLDPVNGVPLDTPEVVAARAAHYQAKALSGYHHLGKRSLGYSAVVAPVAHSAVVAPVAYNSALAYTAPVAYSSPLVSSYSVAAPVAVAPRAYSVHPW